MQPYSYSLARLSAAATSWRRLRCGLSSRYTCCRRCSLDYLFTPWSTHSHPVCSATCPAARARGRVALLAAAVVGILTLTIAAGVAFLNTEPGNRLSCSSA